MTARITIENLVSMLEEYLKYAEEFKEYSREEIEKDLKIRLSVERLLYVITQTTIELANAIISYRNYRKPVSFRESFHVLYEHKIISQELMSRLRAC